MSRFARSRVENYCVFPHVTRYFFFTPARNKERARTREGREEESKEIRRNANGVVFFHPRAPLTLARTIYGLSRYRRNIRTLTTLYIYNGVGCFIGHSIVQRIASEFAPPCPALREITLLYKNKSRDNEW